MYIDLPLSAGFRGIRHTRDQKFIKSQLHNIYDLKGTEPLGNDTEVPFNSLSFCINRLSYLRVLLSWRKFSCKSFLCAYATNNSLQTLEAASDVIHREYVKTKFSEISIGIYVVVFFSHQPTVLGYLCYDAVSVTPQVVGLLALSP